jgi:hypothetical protein
VLPGGCVQPKPFWKRQRVDHSIRPWLGNGPTVGVSAAVVIAKNPAKGQCLVDDIPLWVILTGYPLNNYPLTIGLMTVGVPALKPGASRSSRSV